MEMLAQLDTGAAWSLLSKETADELGLFEAAGEDVAMWVQGSRIKGKLVRADLELLADEGASLSVEATVLISQEWNDGNFIGYRGLLEHIRIGLDPAENRFYFGPI